MPQDFKFIDPISKRNNEIMDNLDFDLNNADAYEQRSTELALAGVCDTRRWKGDELAKAVGVKSKTSIYQAEKDGRLPADYKDIRNDRGYDLKMVNEVRRLFSTNPGRRDGDRCMVFSFTNFKGGCYKTLTTLQVAACAATEGFRVLVVDLDAQGTLSFNLGHTPDVSVMDGDTLGPSLLEDCSPTRESVKNLALPTYIDGLDIIPANMGLQTTEINIQSKLVNLSYQDMDDDVIKSRQKDLFLRVHDILTLIKSEYDVIFIDGTPALGMLPLNIAFASDRMIVPCPTESPDYMSTCTFWEVLRSRFEEMRDLSGDKHPLPEISVLPTRFGVHKNETVASQIILHNAIYPTFTSKVMKNVVRKHDSAISQQNLWRRTMFDVPFNALKVKKQAQESCMENYQSIWNEIREEFVYPYWPSTEYPLNADAQVRAHTTGEYNNEKTT